MAASKDTRRSAPDTNPFFLKLFRDSRLSKERKRLWQDAVQHAGTEDPPLRFPVYRHLYLLNVYAQKMVELLEELSRKFAINTETLPYHQALLQYVRASASHSLIDFMAGVEQTEAWLHDSQRRVEEENVRDPDDVYFSVRQREAERLRQGLPPRLQFLDDSLPVNTSPKKRRRVARARQTLEKIRPRSNKPKTRKSKKTSA